ncbi:Bug family tripartite tricarboxylate transporter substrate binding protein [Verminephrobacter eiseniae]|uniref:Bug family tripartite tricarboxylate transporter substrate binding protein n=1 Tax=Verminephrobacter eiseniae TaxID=364317 RepID=UPI002237D9B9|nr:tripartite tricarboxylate transporter substrate binding protein [Verminephrobacter eiseniae]MCW5231435.1 tripartite tricarboxylate transporter substrate binding protein [Verminephrobacter eiseniae]MCW5293166.1 tripartite tricarboxylate transporter substrate binding protein [Verminephrobacter eiseniae]MCW8186977.1 tripartite tricarboxylate transporter substrate binding protein [Verminephrobacter eiseniae]MCW8225379.1 tripartite tricarboxylate transporter substrate binding protein [Verminephro
MKAAADCSRRQALGTGLGFVATALAPGVAAAQGPAAWPGKAVTLVVGAPPGGQTDFAIRVQIPGLQAALGQPCVIDNRPGVGGNISVEHVLKGPSDGYRLLVGNGGNMTMNPHTYRNTPMVDPRRLVPIGLLLQSALVLAVHPDVGAKNFSELLAWVKAQDGIDYASSGPGSLTQATMELLRERMGRPAMTHIAYKGSAPALQDLIAGRVKLMFDAVSVIAPFVRSGHLRALMVTSDRRVPALAQVPTADELGLKDFIITSFIGLYGPPGLSPEIVRKANAALNQSMADPVTVKTITDRGDEPGGGTPERLMDMTHWYYKTWGQVAQANDIRAD